MLTRNSSPARARLAILLALSAVLRVWLAIAGGQRWWPDEQRFTASLDAVRAGLLGHGHGVLMALFGSADHVGFKVLGVVPALAVTAGAPMWVAAVFFGAFSVGSIYLVWRIALLTSADELVAWWSAFFAAISVSLFYYSRHLLPYDPALFFGLYAIVVGWRERTAKSAFVAGLWAAAGFLTYNGYWLFCGAGLLVAVIGPAPRIAVVVRRAAAGLGGLVVPIAAALLLGYAAGKDLFHGALGFAQTVNFGDFDDGWSFAWRYFRVTEGWLPLVWALAIAVGLAARRRRRYVLVWLGVLAFLYLGLGIMSAVAHQFVVYGRIARCFVPFFALICGAAMAELSARRRGLPVAVAVVLVVAAAVRFSTPLAQWFPDDFAARGRKVIAEHGPAERIRVVNAYSMYRPMFVEPAAIAETLFARPHPLQYEPFLYENLTRERRAFFQAHDLTMRVVRLRADAPGAVGIAPAGLDGYPGPLQLTLRLPNDGNAYTPLLVTGTSARSGDYLNLVRSGPNRFRVSFVHWYATECLSPELTLDEERDHVLEVSFGSLFPPATGAREVIAPPWDALRRWVFVSIDGRPVFNRPSAFYPATPGGIDLGCNYLGGVTSDGCFRGQIRGVAALPPDEVLRAVRNALHAGR